MELYDFQSASVVELMSGKHFLISGTGSGKSAIAMVWAEQKCQRTGKNKVLIVTTASKCRARTAEGLNDFEDEAMRFCSPTFLPSLSSLVLLSWHKLARWTKEHLDEIKDYVIIWDEVAKAGAGISSAMGTAFLKITKANDDWAGFTATPGDTWLKFYPYFTACNLVRNKTSFMARFARVQTYKGYPEIIGWNEESELKRMWATISYAPDTSKVMSELPKETHKTIRFERPAKYAEVLRTRENPDTGDFIDTTGGLCSCLRQMCFTKDKQEWIKDFVEGLETNCVFFYNFIKTGDMLEDIISKALPRDARVWRIDGKHHDIPTATTIGKHDMILCQWQSGSEALNLQFVHYWVGVELCYSYSTLIQGLGRIRRIGQKYPMFFVKLLCYNSIEMDIARCLYSKKEFSEEVWVQNKISQ